MIRVFVGTSANGEDVESQAVLEYTLRKNSSSPISITWMRLSHNPVSFWYGWNTERWATPFSAFRWGIPAACGFRGRAIYTDSDVIFNGDIAELWNQPMGGKVVLAKSGGRLCVSLWDCEKAKAFVMPLDKLKTDPASHSYMSAKARLSTEVGVFSGNWNCLDGEHFKHLDDPAIKAIHYTDMSCQPHLRYAVPRLASAGLKHWFNGRVRSHPRPEMEELFDKLLEKARDAGFRPENYLPVDPYGDYKKKSLTNYRGRAA